MAGSIDPGGSAPATSGKAIASLALGVVFVLACLTGVPAILLGLWALGDIRASGGRLGGRGLAQAGIALGGLGCLFTVALMLPAIRSSREAAWRGHCVNNLKQIGIALHNYFEVWGSLPPAAVADAEGRPLLSWRVLLIPYIKSSPLYARFRLD